MKRQSGTIDEPLSVTLGSAAITATVTNDGTFSTPAKQDTGNASLASIDTKVGEVQASPTSNTVLARLKDLLTGIVLAAGSAIIGKVGIDQTTPGTTNGVQVNAALPAGTSVIGNVKDAGYQNATWAVKHAPSANTVATITQASAGGSTKNVCLGFTATLCAGATAPTAVQLFVALIDGATGGTTYLWYSVVSLPAVAGAISSFNIQMNHGFEGTAATAMTLEFSVAGGANTIESVSMFGTTRL